MRLYDSRPVRVYLAFNTAKEEWMSESHWESPVSFSREKSERTVNLPSSHICLLLWRMIFLELALGRARGSIREIPPTFPLRSFRTAAPIFRTSGIALGFLTSP